MHVDEVAHLLAVLVDHRLAAEMEAQAEHAAGAAVGVVEALARALHDRIAHRHARDAVALAQRQRHALLGDLRQPVLVLRVGHRFVGALPLQRAGEARRRLQFPQAALELLGRADVRQHGAAGGVVVQAFAERGLAGRDDHLSHRQLLAHDQFVDQRGAGDVDVEEAAEGGQVVLEGGQVVDHLAAAKRVEQHPGIAHVAAHELDARVQVGRHGVARVHRLFERVEHAHLVAVAQQRVGGVRTDEAGTAGDQDLGHWLCSSRW